MAAIPRVELTPEEEQLLSEERGAALGSRIEGIAPGTERSPQGLAGESGRSWRVAIDPTACPFPWERCRDVG